ncbi:MAG: oxidoreductase [Nitrospinae bacterium RIFCSPLOWO2_02_FULL_39_110]|nr:MAG: oxidoreductase [Nitrospinae bacterium RIFCSPHIGHO2_02_39_11]OGW00848.1 MAG: oxidoreductase [Nitrospinae bacterium RIFCSPHIGHO2_12_FULL_39_42]OGW02429.1 MAG: oxidoreductase [Nitrospinae bacterium RIFCSPHIGHO2_02_FULL_39_82]OGW03464.1 MAG: oxidoreductase [Nitrospinae bacterium RIFCSPLOWO2_02_FULL_39_110]OGW04976.1 MAG: oxidoreductase [Nitrospinae bacterium RIFCSPLOWO2_02_39_17]OGW08055.1 MAG: oxidoreductase [Nitrospinae bacterium RIFCSPLOWO2_12_FULL_39_93]OGW08256.1 MAG: oxidoreductase 
MGQYHVGVYSEIPDVRLIGIADINETRGKEIAEKYNTKSYGDYKKLLGKVDVASIAVPTSLHYKIAKDFLQAGTNILIEKPMTRSIDEARELFNIAEKKGLTLHIGHVERFNGAVQELKKIVDNPLFIESRRLGPYDPRIQDDGVVMDLMIHDIDIILNLLNSKVRDINVVGKSVFSDKDDLCNVQLKFENGCLATITASRATQHKIRTLAITQKDKYIFLDYTNQDIHIHRQAFSEHSITKQELRYKQESFTERIFVHRENPLKIELKHLIDCATNGAERKVSVAEEIYSLQIALEIEKRSKLINAL